MLLRHLRKTDLRISACLSRCLLFLGPLIFGWAVLATVLTTVLTTVATTAHADSLETPGGVVTRFLELIQRQKNYDRAADYVHWEETYRRLGSQQQVLFTILQIGSAERLREVMLLGIKDPKRFVHNMATELTQELSFLAHSEGIVSAQLEPLVEPYLDEVARAKSRAEQLAFGPPQASVNGSQAVVKMEATEKGRKATVTIPLQNSRGRWLINPLNIVVRDAQPTISREAPASTYPLPRKAPPAIKAH